MKYIKISLIILALAILAYFVFQWVENVSPPKKAELPRNAYIDSAYSERNAIDSFPYSSLKPSLYSIAQYHIDEFYNNQFLGTDSSNNAEWRDILSSDLYTSYSQKFISQSNYVFKNSAWASTDISLINSELQKLKASKYLDNNGPVASAFTKINTILLQYNNINGFISTCNGTSFSGRDESQSLSLKNQLIQKANSYLGDISRCDLKNCTRLSSGLNAAKSKINQENNTHIENLKKKATSTE